MRSKNLSSFVSAEKALGLNYRFDVIAEEQGGYTIVFPDLPGCMTQIEDAASAGEVAEEIKTLWIETTRDLGLEIPAPTYPEVYSGKLNVRLPKSLHRKLAQQAVGEGVSLNQWIVSLLAGRSVTTPAEEIRKPARTSEETSWVDLGDTTNLALDVPDVIAVRQLSHNLFSNASIDPEQGTDIYRPDNVIPFESRHWGKQESEPDESLAISV